MKESTGTPPHAAAMMPTGTVLLGGDLACKEVGDGGEVGGGVGIADGPDVFDVSKRIVAAGRLHVEEADLRIGCGGDLGSTVLYGGIRAETLEGHLHVGLAGGEPDVADEQVGDGLAAVARVANDGEGVRAASAFGAQPCGPLAEPVGNSGDLLVVEGDGELPTRSGPSQMRTGTPR